MKTLAEAYAARHARDPNDFQSRVFWMALHRRAFLFVPLLWWTDFFAVDRELIATCGRARGMREVHEALVDYAHHPKNSLWLRRWLRIRVSTTRLKQIARSYMAGTDAAGGDLPHTPGSGTLGLVR